MELLQLFVNIVDYGKIVKSSIILGIKILFILFEVFLKDRKYKKI